VNGSILKDHRRLLIVGLVGIFALIVPGLRWLPMVARGTGDTLSKVACDQIEDTSTIYKVPESAVMQEMSVGPAQLSGTMPRRWE
jgi:hypothetical protein